LLGLGRALPLGLHGQLRPAEVDRARRELLDARSRPDTLVVHRGPRAGSRVVLDPLLDDRLYEGRARPRDRSRGALDGGLGTGRRRGLAGVVVGPAGGTDQREQRYHRAGPAGTIRMTDDGLDVHDFEARRPGWTPGIRRVD